MDILGYTETVQEIGDNFSEIINIKDKFQAILKGMEVTNKSNINGKVTSIGFDIRPSTNNKMDAKYHLSFGFST